MRLRGFLLMLVLSPAWAESPSALWIDVPYVHQPTNGCGAAVLSMVMQYWAQKQGMAQETYADVDRIQQQLYSPKDHGISSAALRAYLMQHGFRAFTLRGSWNDLAEQLKKGRPLIAALKPQGQGELHYVVIDGVDTAHGLVTMNDPAERKLIAEERAGFEKDWKATENWMLLAVPSMPLK